MSKIHLMTTSPFENDGKLSISDQLIWNELLERNIAGLQFSPNEVNIQFTHDSCRLKVQEQFLDSGDVLLVRLMRGAAERAYEVARVFKSLGGRVSDPVNTLLYSGSKLLPYIKRNDAIRCIPAYFFNVSSSAINQIVSTTPFPFILKPQNGFQGIGVSLISSEAELKQYVQDIKEKDLIMQPFLNISEEFRVVVVGGKSLGAVRKKRSGHNSFLAESDIDEVVHDKEVLNFAEHAAQLSGGDVYGTDIALSTDGNLYLIENNRCPNFVTFRDATGIKVEEKIIDFIVGG